MYAEQIKTKIKTVLTAKKKNSILNVQSPTGT